MTVTHSKFYPFYQSSNPAGMDQQQFTSTYDMPFYHEYGLGDDGQEYSAQNLDINDIEFLNAAQTPCAHGIQLSDPNTSSR